jgi:hypothetical protein
LPKIETIVRRQLDHVIDRGNDSIAKLGDHGRHRKLDRSLRLASQQSQPGLQPVPGHDVDLVERGMNPVIVHPFPHNLQLLKALEIVCSSSFAAFAGDSRIAIARRIRPLASISRACADLASLIPIRGSSYMRTTSSEDFEIALTA